ncbi:signal transduction histidine kinase [Edaphobacter modestus]|uniref:Oxygen sensor histidine kinase NreB n=2 Tax=Edaphobacter modestus TaxID=388466 RepID=A0A4Q7YWH0_9BACT|nr:signal transduction histidine kinase [Edaphobacter modestus]
MTVDSSATIESPLTAGRRILWLGFGAILLVMVYSSIDIARSLRKTSSKSDQLMKSFRERDNVLDELRNTMIRSGTMIRDYLSENDDSGAERDRLDLQAAREQTEQLLDSYSNKRRGISSAEERKAFLGLRNGVEAYWNSFAPMLRWDSTTRRREGNAYRQKAIGPLRGEVFRLSWEITALSNQQLDAEEGLVESEQQKFRLRLLVSLIVEFLIAIILALAVISRIRGLEEAVEGQYSKVLQGRSELRDLTARLESAQEEERRNLSRELHDEVGQSMAAMLVELGRLESAPWGDDGARSRLSALREQAEQSVRSVRDIALLLRPSMLDDLGLVPALKWQGRETARRTGLRIRVDAEESNDELPDSYKTCIYRVVQEALHNAVKHAKAKSIRISFRQATSGMDLRIEDDGIGFDPETEKGLGLLGIEERIMRLDGEIKVTAKVGQGTVLTVHLPRLDMEKTL